MVAASARPRVRRPFRRLALWVGPVLLLIAVWQVFYYAWDRIEQRRLEEALVRVFGDGPRVQTYEGNRVDASRLYDAAIVASRSASPVQVAPGTQPLWPVTAERDALARGAEIPTRIREAAVAYLEQEAVVLDLVERASREPWLGSPGQGRLTHSDRFRVVADSAALQTLELVVRGETESAVASLFVRMSMLRAVRPGSTSGLGAILPLYDKVAVVQGIATDTGILVAHLQPSADELRELDEALGASVAPDELEQTIRQESMAAYDFARRLVRDRVLRPLVWQQMADRLEGAAEAIEAARLPWPDRLEAVSTIAEAAPLIGPDMPLGLPLDLLRGVTVTLADGVASVRSARVALRIEQFRRDQGRLPESLDELDLAREDEVAQDPFTGERLRYAGDGDGFVVYSVGADLKDDGGMLDRVSPYGRDPAPDVGVRVPLTGGR